MVRGRVAACVVLRERGDPFVILRGRGDPCVILRERGESQDLTGEFVAGGRPGSALMRTR